MLELKIKTDPAWVDIVMNDFDRFLIDHAHAEKKAAGMATSMLSHYSDKQDIVRSMVDLSIEEMIHFKQVLKLMHERELTLTPDEKDPYVNALRQCFRKGRDVYLLDRLLVAAVVEARGCERFGLVAQALPEGKLKSFYDAITKSEAKHHELFTDLAVQYFDRDTVKERLEEILIVEADIIRQLPHRACLH